VIRESGTTQASDSIWCSLYKSFTQILSVQLIFSAAYTFDVAWSMRQLILRCSLYFRQLILSEGVFNRSRVLTRTRGGWVRSTHCLYRLCVCCGGIVWRVYVWRQVCATGIYDNLLGFGLTCVLSAAAINLVFSRFSCKYAKSRAHWKINEEQKFWFTN
jgi:hypothetical protein